jgi:hypothetical protein
MEAVRTCDLVTYTALPIVPRFSRFLPAAHGLLSIELFLAIGTPTATYMINALNRSVWTTEKEINIFLNNGWASEITQTIQGSSLQNNIPFVRDRGFFAVAGSLATPDARGIRTEFVFETATLQLGPLGPFTLPPIGKGWFDTVYLDDDLRIDTNSRDDILICEPFPVTAP